MCFLYLLRIVFSCKKHQRQPRAWPKENLLSSPADPRKAGLGWQPEEPSGLAMACGLGTRAALWLPGGCTSSPITAPFLAEDQGGPSSPLKGTRCLGIHSFACIGLVGMVHGSWEIQLPAGHDAPPKHCGALSPGRTGQVHSAEASSEPAGGESGSGGLPGLAESWLLSRGW